MDENIYRRWDWRRVLALAAGWAVILGAVGPGVAWAATPLGPWPPEQMALAGARVAWQVHLPMSYTASIKSYHLVDGYLYGIGTDGYVRAIRADTGEYVWTQKLAEPFDTLWPPVAARLEVVRKEAGDSPKEAGESEAEESVKETVDAVVFTLVRTAVFLDPKTGLELKQVRLGSSSNAAVAVSKKHCFEVGPNRRLRCVSLADGMRKWRMATPAPIDLAPVYVARDDVVVVVDSQGMVGGVTSDKIRQFTQSLGAKPIGWLAADELAVYVATADELAVYVATADKTLHAIDRASNRILWQYRLADRPAGGPVVSKNNVYQATIGAGLYCKHKSERLNWHHAGAKRFLAEWPSRTAVLYHNGHIGLLHPQTGKPAELLDPGSAAEGVSNPWNDAVILASPKGLVRCIRPIGAKALTLADFRPAPPPAPETPAAAAGESTGENDMEAVGAEVSAEPAAARTSDELLLSDPLRSKRRIGP